MGGILNSGSNEHLNLLNKAEVFWSISSPGHVNIASAFGTSVRCAALNKLAEASVTKRMATGQHPRAVIAFIEMVRANGAAGRL
jgi:hypothetical protein